MITCLKSLVEFKPDCPAKAINATARKIAVIFHNMLKNKTAYISQSQEEYDRAHEQRILKQLQQKAVQFGLELVPIA